MSDELMKIEETSNDSVVSYNQPICTVNPADNEGKRLILNAINGAVSLNKHMNEPLQICDCITQMGMRRSRNNLPDAPCVNSYLIDVNGVAYFSQSDGVGRSVYTIASLWPDFGKESTEEGYLLLKCVETPLSNGNTLKTIVLA